MINFILLGVMRRLNGRNTQSSRSIAISDKETELTTAQRKPLDTAIQKAGLARSILPSPAKASIAKREGRLKTDEMIPLTAKLANKK